MKRAKGVVRLIDNSWLYIAWQRGMRRFLFTRQFPNGVKSYFFWGLEVSFPSWRNRNKSKGGQ